MNVIGVENATPGLGEQLHWTKPVQLFWKFVNQKCFPFTICVLERTNAWALYLFGNMTIHRMEQHNLKNVNNYLNTNIYSWLKTSGGQSSNLYLNVVHFLNTSVNSTSVTV